MRKPFFPILKAALLTGTLDILSAFTYYYIKTGETKFFDVLKFVASGIWGKDAFMGGNEMIVAGAIIHYFIAFAFTVFFFLLYPHVSILSKNRAITAIVYGIFVWVVMNLLVLPFTNIPDRPFNSLNAFINICILIVCIGFPLSYIAYAWYRKQRTLVYTNLPLV